MGRNYKKAELNRIESRISNQVFKDGTDFELITEETKQKIHNELAVMVTCGEGWTKQV